MAAIRREYFRLPHDLGALTRSFGILLPPLLHRDAVVLVFAIECADRFLDDIPEAGARARFGGAILSCLRREKVATLPPELAGRLAQLNKVASRLGATSQVQKIIEEILRNSERLRATRSETRYVACTVKEGRLMADLLLLLLAGHSTPAFDSFMRQLSGPASLVDKLRDVRRDYERGEIALPPTWSFRARLTYAIFRRIVRLGRLHAMNWRLAVWGIQALFAELFWFHWSRLFIAGASHHPAADRVGKGERLEFTGCV